MTERQRVFTNRGEGSGGEGGYRTSTRVAVVSVSLDVLVEMRAKERGGGDERKIK